MSIQNIDEKLLEGLSQEEREVVFAMMKELAKEGKSKTYQDLLYADYAEIPVDIETFMFDKRYLGNGLIDADGRKTVFPYWVKTLKKIFPNNMDTAYNTIILTGAIGIGKSFVAVIAELYMMYKMLCLKDPYLYYGMQPIDKISFSMISFTLDAARGVAWDKMQQLLQSSPWFMSHGKITGTDNLIWKPTKKPGQIGTIELVVGSKESHITGRAVFCAFTDEVNFSAVTTDADKIKKKMSNLISKTDARMISRFLRGNKLPTLNIIASSKNSDQSYLDTYIETKKKNESKTTLIIDEAQWVVDERKNLKEKFYVAVGNKLLASEVLPKIVSPELLDNFRDRGYSILPVPASTSYWEAFNDNVEVALNDLAGISTVGARKYIAGPRFKQIKTNIYRNPFTRDVISTGTKDTLNYSDFFDIKAIADNDLNKPLYVHLDMSKSGDKTGIAGVWIKGRKEDAEESREMYYKVAFSVSVEAPKGDEISFEKSREFIRWLKDIGLNIKSVTADQYQSSTVLQQLRGDGFEAKELSVDKLEATQGTKQKICKPYHFFRSTIYDNRLELYEKCDLLTDEVIGLELQPDGHVDHPDSGTSGSKDQADAVCGALYDASLHLEEFKFFNDTTLEDIVELNEKLDNESNYIDAFNKAFEKELLNSRFAPKVGKIEETPSEETNFDWMDIIL